jgi:ABC-type siderophore export system fused ATPase/permease subunit
MLSTIMISLLCIWLAIMILGQVIGGVIGYKMFKSLTSEDK